MDKLSKDHAEFQINYTKLMIFLEENNIEKEKLFNLIALYCLEYNCTKELIKKLEVIDD